MSTASASSLSSLHPRRAIPRPLCTHPTMDKVFGTDFHCQVCGKVPSMGWIYACHSDAVHSQVEKTRKKLKKATNRIMPNELELLGFNKTVVKAAADGFYTDEELELLKAQKIRVKTVIAATENEKERFKARNGVPADVLNSTLASIAESTSEPDERKMTLVGDEKPRKKANTRFGSKVSEPCDWRVCHTCRPFSRDRSFVSFEAVFANDVPPVSTWIPEFMPVANAEILRNMDWERELSTAGAQEEEEDDDFDDDEINIRFKSRTPNRPESSYGFRHSLEDSFDKMIQDDRTVKAITVKNPEKVRDAGFDLALWKAMMKGVQDEASATRLPGKDSDDNLKNGTQNGHMEEQHVGGGVALTEEAAETHSADIIMSI